MLGWIRGWGRSARACRERFPALFATDAMDGDLVALDTETTGLDPKRAEIVAIGAVRIRGNRLLTSQGFSAVVKPTRPIDPASIRIHQIRPVDVQRGGLDVATAIERLVAFIGPRPLVGYYLEFDIAVIDRTMRELAGGAGIRLPNERIEVSALYYDTVLRKRQSLQLYGQVDLRMETIRRDLSLPAFPQHDATSDAVMAGLMYLKLRELAEGGDRTPPRPTEKIPLSPRGRGPG